MKISIIISTYNRPDALNAVLSAFEFQSGSEPGEWEIVIADDGSSESTHHVIEKLKNKFGGRLKHVWHPDQGFRLAEIRNRAVLSSTGDYLVFLDGDCIPMTDFISKHIKLAETGKVVAGNRILLSEKYTSELLNSLNPCEPIYWSIFNWFMAKLTGKTNKSVGWVRLNLEKWRTRRSTDWKVLRGCNIGVWRKDFFVVDGFDADFSGWGFEDSDFAVRLLRAGILIKNGRFAVPVLHLWHKENDKSQQAENWNKFETSLYGDHIKAKLGMSHLLV